MHFKDEFLKFVKFNAVGVLNTGIDFAIFTVLTAFGLGDLIAQVISYCIAMVNSYFFNSRWTFRDKQDSVMKSGRFVVVNLVALGVSLGAIAICNSFGIEGLLAKVIALPFSLAVNFLGNRLFVFNQKSDGEQ